MRKYNYNNLIFIIPILIVFGGLIVFKAINNIEPGLSSSGTQAIIRGQGVFARDKKVQLEIADTLEAQRKGLSQRESLSKDAGMLFVFQDKQERTFVMRNMLFPLDIIWIDDSKVVGFLPNLKPEGEDYNQKYSSDMPVNYALEVNAGFCEENGIKIGDRIIIESRK